MYTGEDIGVATARETPSNILREAAMVETVLVTGGTGFIGGWCIQGLLERGYRVRTTVRSLAKEASIRAAVASADADGRLTLVVADLTDDAGWDAAMAGCDYVLHVASPLGGGANAPDDFTAPARDGTLRVLRAATKAGVKRVVMTSAAATARPPLGSDAVADETVWSDPGDRKWDPYRLSKILAERAAWDFMASAGRRTELTTVLPGAVFGPVLNRESISSVRIIQGLLHGRPPGLPRLGFWIVDVRDLADVHIAAMTAPEAAGQRFLATGDFMWMADMADALRAGLGDRGAKVPTRRLPDVFVRALALFNPQMKMLVKDLGKRNRVTSAKARRVLGFSPRPAATTMVECAESLLAR
jgi:dihydroflavonol-4-reductase